MGNEKIKKRICKTVKGFQSRLPLTVVCSTHSQSIPDAIPIHSVQNQEKLPKHCAIGADNAAAIHAHKL